MNLPGEADAAGRVWAIVGASGFVGSALAEGIRVNNGRVIKIVAPRLSFAGARTIDSLKVELKALPSVITELALAIEDADIVINAAGLALPDAADSNELIGANSLLPAVVAQACTMASKPKPQFVHISSAAVQGARAELDETRAVSPFSPYSMSKALAERMLLEMNLVNVDLKIIRATSVQGEGRRTTSSLQRIARSPLACVAQPGDRPSTVSSIDGLVKFAIKISALQNREKVIHLQPWEGATTGNVLFWAGHRKSPKKLPAWLCRLLLHTARLFSRFVGGRLSGSIRRIEVMWFGQPQSNGRGELDVGISDTLRRTLSGADHTDS